MRRSLITTLHYSSVGKPLALPVIVVIFFPLPLLPLLPLCIVYLARNLISLLSVFQNKSPVVIHARPVIITLQNPVEWSLKSAALKGIIPFVM
jgi:hypothetical protein